MNTYWLLPPSLMLLLVCNVGLAASEHVKVTATQITKLAVQTAAPQAAEQAQLNDLPARVVVPPRQLHLISAPLAGVVTQVAVPAGQWVRRGELLFQIASPGVAQLRKDVSQAAIHLQLAERTAKRDQQLLDEGLIAESRYRASQASLAEARVVQTERREAMRLAGVDPRAGADSSVAIRAPIDGIVMELMVSPSARVEASAALAKVAIPDPLWLEIQVPLRDAARVAAGALVALAGSTLTARIVATSSDVAADSQSVIVRAELANSARRLRPGQFFSVSVPMTPLVSGPLWRLPSAALVRIDEQALVFVRDDSGFRLVPITVHSANGDQSVVSGKITSNDAIVVTGATSLKAIAIQVGGSANQ